MEIRVLRYFLEVAREENITKAAAFLHVSQPTLSRQLKELEEELGRPLFVRSSHRIHLTDEGQLLRKRAEDILDMVDKTASEFKSLDEITGGDIRIGCAESSGLSFFMHAARAVQKRYPNIHFHFYSSGTDAVTERIDKGLLDMAVIVQSADLSKYNCITVPYKDRWGILARDDDPLAGKSCITLDELKDLPLIVSHQGIQEELLSWFGEETPRLHIAATYDLLFNTTLMVKEGLGYPIGFDNLVHTGKGSGLVFIPLSPELSSPMHVIWKKYQAFTPASKILLEELEKELR